MNSKTPTPCSQVNEVLNRLLPEVEDGVGGQFVDEALIAQNPERTGPELFNEALNFIR